MPLQLSLLLLLLLPLAAKGANQDYPVNVTSFINNGLISGAQPHNVHVMGFRNAAGPNEASSIFGGGSIISTRHVVTAAHLIQGFGNFQVGYGNTQLFQLAVAYPATAVIYPNYVPSTRQHDIAILALRVGTTWSLPAAARPIRWATSTVDPLAGRVATVVGFGFTFPNEGFPSLTLRQATLQTAASAASCQGSVSITGSHFCAMPQTGRNVCTGDNGAGLFANDASGPVLVSLKRWEGVLVWSNA